MQSHSANSKSEIEVSVESDNVVWANCMYASLITSRSQRSHAVHDYVKLRMQSLINFTQWKLSEIFETQQLASSVLRLVSVSFFISFICQTSQALRAVKLSVCWDSIKIASLDHFVLSELIHIFSTAWLKWQLLHFVSTSSSHFSFACHLNSLHADLTARDSSLIIIIKFHFNSSFVSLLAWMLRVTVSNLFFEVDKSFFLFFALCRMQASSRWRLSSVSRFSCSARLLLDFVEWFINFLINTASFDFLCDSVDRITYLHACIHTHFVDWVLKNCMQCALADLWLLHFSSVAFISYHITSYHITSHF